MCRFGLPHTIIFDNRTNFACKQVSNFCAKYNIIHRFSTSYYLQDNGHAEINNHTILDNLCKSLNKTKGKWVEKLPRVFWAYRTTKRVPTGKTPFSLAYITEVIIPVDINMLTLRMEEVDQNQYDAQLLMALDQLRKSDYKRKSASQLPMTDPSGTS